MVAAITRLTPEQIEMELPYAQGLQYQAIWIDMQGGQTEPAHAIDTAGSWRRIAGK